LRNDRSHRKLDLETHELPLKDLQTLFIEWLLGDHPPDETQADFAARWDLHPGTLSKWKKDEVFCRNWERRMRETHASPDKQNDLLEALFVKAMVHADSKDIETYFKLIDKMTPSKVEIDDKRSLASLSDAELAEMVEDLDNVEFLQG